jgi:hypothetical protein
MAGEFGAVDSSFTDVELISYLNCLGSQLIGRISAAGMRFAEQIARFYVFIHTSMLLDGGPITKDC